MESTTLGTRVRDRRKALGLSVEKLRDRVMPLVPARYFPGIKTFYRIESGEVPESHVDGILICAIAKVLGCRISDLSDEVAEEHDAVCDLLASSLRWITTECDGQLDLLTAA